MTNNTTLRAAISAIVAFVFASPVLAELQALTNFRSCLSGTATTCVLQPAGTYILDVGLGEIVVTNPNVLTISGASVTPTDTVLKRPDGATGMVHIMNIQKANVTIQDLTFDGNKAGNAGVPEGWADLLLYAANISVIDVYFDQAVHFALQLGTNSTVAYCTFMNSRDAGIYGGGAYTSFNISGNTFRDNGGGAAAIYTRASSLSQAYFEQNQLLYNHRMPYPYDQTIFGGQLLLGDNSSYIRVTGNFIDGGNLWGNGTGRIYGIEAYGYNHHFEGNYIRYHTGPGMHLGGLVDSTIIGGANYWEIRENLLDGIALLNFSGYPNTSNVTIDGIRVNSNSWNGIKVQPNGYGNITGIVIQNTASISGNALYPVCAVAGTGVTSDVPVNIGCN